MTDEAALRRQVREQLATGSLPRGALRRAWGGRGIGQGGSCPVCSHELQANEPELQIEFTHENNPPYFDIFHLHPRCFAVWELERTA
jgi:hypothetical protein